MTKTATRSKHLLSIALVALAASLLVFVGTQPAEAAFPGENGKIAFAYDAGYIGGPSGIYTMNPDGTGQKSLTTGYDYDPAFSPDGEKIAFTTDQDGNSEVYVMDASDGSNQVNLTGNPASDYLPAFSPDGKVAFVSDRDGNTEIYVTNADGSGTPIRLTDNPASDSSPAFSPDGSKIAFVSDRDGNPEIYVMNPDGSGTPTRLTDNPANDGSPNFSPDGARIAFTSDRDDLPGDIYANNDIYVMNSGGSNPTNLTNSTDSADTEPAFSPDGTKITFQSYWICMGFCAANVWGPTISAMNVDGSGHIGLGDTEFGYAPDWGTLSPDTTPPDTTAPDTTITSGPSGPTKDNTPSFSFSGSDNLSMGASLAYSYKVDNGDWSAYSPETNATLGGASGLSNGPHTLYVKAKDEAGNEDASPAKRSFRVDTAAPTGTVSINNAATRTRTRSVTLTLNATDPSPGSGVTEMRISNSQSGLSSAAWEPYATSKSWILTAGAGTKTVYVQYRDAGGNVSAVVQDTIKYSP